MKELLLRVKIKSLTEETKIIRHEEKLAKWKAKAARARSKQESENKHLHHFGKLEEHRKIALRKEARATYLAYGFLRGKPMSQIEAFSYVQPDWERVERMALKYWEGDPREAAQKFSAWKADALDGVECIQRGGVELLNGTIVLDPISHSIKATSKWLTRHFLSYKEFYEYKSSINILPQKKPYNKVAFLKMVAGTDSSIGLEETHDMA